MFPIMNLRQNVAGLKTSAESPMRHEWTWSLKISQNKEKNETELVQLKTEFIIVAKG